ncbi:MAG: hypothetical protein P8X84_03855, partial [Candidatus Bathyarchaeota archaeon]
NRFIYLRYLAFQDNRKYLGALDGSPALMGLKKIESKKDFKIKDNYPNTLSHGCANGFFSQ